VTYRDTYKANVLLTYIPKSRKNRAIRTNIQTATEMHPRDTEDAAYTFEMRTEHGAL